MSSIFNFLNLLKGRQSGGVPNFLSGAFNKQNFNNNSSYNENMNNFYNNNSNYNYNNGNNLHNTNFSTPQNQQQKNMQNSATSAGGVEYPYGDFPVKYTKRGQEMLREQYLNKGKEQFNYDNFNVNKNNFNAGLNSYNNFSQNYENNSNNSYNSMQNNTKHNQQNVNNSALDVNSLLPLLNGMMGKGANNDMLSSLMPLLGNKTGGNLNVNDLIKLISNNNNVKTSSTETDAQKIISQNDKIDDYKKIS